MGPRSRHLRDRSRTNNLLLRGGGLRLTLLRFLVLKVLVCRQVVESPTAADNMALLVGILVLPTIVLDTDWECAAAGETRILLQLLMESRGLLPIIIAMTVCVLVRN